MQAASHTLSGMSRSRCAHAYLHNPAAASAVLHVRLYKICMLDRILRSDPQSMTPWTVMASVVKQTLTGRRGRKR